MDSHRSIARQTIRLLLPLLLGAAAVSARAAHAIGDEVGRWQGFAHATGSNAPGSHIVLDLTSDSANTGLTGTLVGLPAVQNSLNVVGTVSVDGTLTLALSGAGVQGVCVGIVRQIPDYSEPTDEDMVADLAYTLVNAASGSSAAGHIDAIHMFGRLGWANLPAVQLVGNAPGAVLNAGSRVAGTASLAVSVEVGSALQGTVSLPAVQFGMVGTADATGSLVMLGDGVPAIGVTPGPAGLLFAGGATMGGGPTQVVGRMARGAFALLLPAVQLGMNGSLSFAYAPPS